MMIDLGDYKMSVMLIRDEISSFHKSDVVEIIDRTIAAESKFEKLAGEYESLQRYTRRLENTNEQLISKLSEIEKQEPSFYASKDQIDDIGDTCNSCLLFKNKDDPNFAIPFYALPVQQSPAVAVPEIKAYAENEDDGDFTDDYVNGWNDCREAMFSTPTPAVAVPELSKKDLEFLVGWCTGQIRDNELDSTTYYGSDTTTEAKERNVKRQQRNRDEVIRFTRMRDCFNAMLSTPTPPSAEQDFLKWSEQTIGELKQPDSAGGK